MSDMTERVHRLGENTARMLAGLWQQHQDGELTRDELVDLAVVILRVSHAQARLAAEAAFTAWKLEQGLPADPENAEQRAEYADPDDRLAEAMRTVLDTSETSDEAGMRIERLGRGEATAAAYGALMGAMRASGIVRGWRRVTEPDACELCNELAARDELLDTDIEMYRHKGCACIPVPEM